MTGVSLATVTTVVPDPPRDPFLLISYSFNAIFNYFNSRE